MLGKITNIQRFSIHDGPGIRTTIFFQGCPLSCIWCQNPEAVSLSKIVLYNSDKCVLCEKCIEVCPNKCFKIENKKINFNSKKCNLCRKCVENCSFNAIEWSSKKMTIEKVYNEIIKDEIYYRVSSGGVTFSGGEPLSQIDFCIELAKKLKKKDIHISIDTSRYIKTDE